MQGPLATIITLITLVTASMLHSTLITHVLWMQEYRLDAAQARVKDTRFHCVGPPMRVIRIIRVIGLLGLSALPRAAGVFAGQIDYQAWHVRPRVL